MTAEPITSLTYTTAEKQVGWIEQTISVTDKSLVLYEECVLAGQQEFPLHTIHDCSHKPLSGGSCLFYLHTDHGVRMFHVSSDPADFLEKFRQLKRRRA